MEFGRSVHLAWRFNSAKRPARKMEDMKHEYHEGPKAGENFEQLARAVFQAPKIAASGNRSPHIGGNSRNARSVPE